MMQALFSLLLLCTIVSCASKNTSVFLKAQEVALAQPKIKTNSTIIDSFVTLTANLGMDKVKLFYTKDGTTPYRSSLLYSKPLKIKDEGVYKFRAFHKDWKASAVVTTILYEKGVLPDNVNWATKANEKYSGLGEQTLINHTKGSLDFMDKQWLGFDQPTKASVVFKQEKFIQKITIGYLVDTKSWIFPPQSVTVHIDDYEKVEVLLSNDISPKSKRLGGVEVLINRAVKKLEIVVNNRKKIPEWHPGKGLGAWLFMDEWIFNE